MPDLPHSPSPRPTRKTPRQATSLVAYAPAPEPEDDDPLLAFAPYLHPCPRGNSITPDKQRKFIATLAASGIVSQAARGIGKSMEALYKLRHRPGAEGFAAAWDAAVERGLTRLEDCALERALHGTAAPIVRGGTIVDWYGKPDNGMLRFLLQQRLPQRYGVGGIGLGGNRPVQPGHPVWEAVREAILADPATQARERKLREALDTARIEVRRLEYSEAELIGEVERLEKEIETVKRHAAEDVARLVRILSG